VTPLQLFSFAMTPLQLFSFIVLPLAIAVVGIVVGETFRAKQMRAPYEPSLKTRTPAEADFIQSALATIASQLNYVASRYNDITTKYGNTQISTLRNHYGPNFAQGAAANQTLREAWLRLDDKSRYMLFNDYEEGRLEAIVRGG
jgi:hypothetical protein